MVRYCAVYGCYENDGTNKTRRLFRLPTDEPRRDYWIKAISRPDLERKSISTLHSSYFVCELHFTNSEILAKYLKRNAVPTLLLPQLEELSGLSKYTQTDEQLKCFACKSQISKPLDVQIRSTSQSVPCGRNALPSGRGVDGAADGDMMEYEDELDTSVRFDRSKDDATVRCSSCQDFIRRFRYICVQCPDFAICGTCEAKTVHPEHYVLRIPGPRPNDEVQAVLKEIRLKLFPETKTASEDSDDDDVDDDDDDYDDEEVEIKIEIQEEVTDEEKSYCARVVSDDPLAQESKMIDRTATDVALVPQVPLNVNLSEISTLIKEEPNPIIDTMYTGRWNQESEMVRTENSEMLIGGVKKESQADIVTIKSTSINPCKKDNTVLSGTSAGISQSTATTSTVTSSVANTSSAGVTKSAAVAYRLVGKAEKRHGVPVVRDIVEHVPFKIKRDYSEMKEAERGKSGSPK